MTFSIFNSKSKRKCYLEEGEPPPEKIVTEGDFLIDQLARKQMKTDISLEEQLNTHKEFTNSQTLCDATTHVAGTRNLEDFQKNLELNNFKQKGLSSRDVEIYTNYLKLGPQIWTKYKEMSGDALQQRINQILLTIADKPPAEVEQYKSRREEEYLNSLKPQSLEMKLLRFAQPGKPQVKGPMDQLPIIQQELMENLDKPDVKKIRKKARSLQRKIDSLAPTKATKQEKLDRPTMWDVQVHVHDPPKIEQVYTCQPQTLYTIDNGQIVKLPKTVKKLSVEEIRKLSKFANYEKGPPSNRVFLKNLSKNVDEGILRSYLYGCGGCSIRVMNGRMRGQAFLEFDDEEQAAKALDTLNGLTIENRPIIAQFGQNKK